jgi:asparagine synthase (glutamine-hydrolysing)
MCGIAGFLCGEVARQGMFEIAAMTDALLSRGPDDQGASSDPEGLLFLGHRRLSILDLSPAGHQPMQSVSGRFVLVFNGEIYNHLEIRAELQAAGAVSAWRGHSDTETLLAALEHWGVEATLNRAVGMFAIAMWDVSHRTLHLARDRFGDKPLYYSWVVRGGILRDWAENLMEATRLEREGYLNPKPIREAWRQHLSGRSDWTSKLWSVLMFQAWLETNS